MLYILDHGATPLEALPTTGKLHSSKIVGSWPTPEKAIEEGFGDALVKTPGGDTTLTEYTQPLLQAKEQAFALIAQEHAETLRRVTGGASVEERDTWPKQEAWAVKYADSNTSSTEKARVRHLLARLLTDVEIDGAATLMGLDPAELTSEQKETIAAGIMSEKILQKAAFTEKLISEAGNAKRTAEQMVAALSSVHEVNTFLGQLHSTKQQREAAFMQSLGG